MTSGEVYQSYDDIDLSTWDDADVTITNDGKMVNRSPGESADVEEDRRWAEQQPDLN